MSILITALSCLVAEVLLLSAGYKILNPRGYRQAVDSYRWLRALPSLPRGILAWSAPPIETACAVAVLIPPARPAGLAATLAVFLIFYVVVGGDDRPIIANCGCWGFTEKGVPKQVLLARNLAPMGVTVTALALNLFAVSTDVAATIGGSRVLGTAAAVGALLPVALLVLEVPELLMIAALRKPVRQQTSQPGRPVLLPVPPPRGTVGSSSASNRHTTSLDDSCSLRVRGGSGRCGVPTGQEEFRELGGVVGTALALRAGAGGRAAQIVAVNPGFTATGPLASDRRLAGHESAPARPFSPSPRVRSKPIESPARTKGTTGTERDGATADSAAIYARLHLFGHGKDQVTMLVARLADLRKQERPVTRAMYLKERCFRRSRGRFA
jgi:uncharacterized membrane protein YphA (DoxX/SURF4 family)